MATHAPFLLTAPTEAPVDVADQVLHSVVGHTGDNALLTSYINAAVAHLDGYDGVLGRCLCTQTWAFWAERWCAQFPLLFRNVANVSVTYLDVAGVEQTVAAQNFVVLPTRPQDALVFLPDFVAPGLSPAHPAPIRIAITAGSAASDVDENLKQIVRLLAAHFYEQREAVSLAAAPAVLPMGVQMLIDSARRRAI